MFKVTRSNFVFYMLRPAFVHKIICGNQALDEHTFPTVAQLLVMLPQFGHQLGSQDFHVGVWRGERGWPAFQYDNIAGHLEVPEHPGDSNR